MQSSLANRRLDLIRINPEGTAVASLPSVCNLDIPSAGEGGSSRIGDFKHNGFKVLGFDPSTQCPIGAFPIRGQLSGIKPAQNQNVLECALNVVSHVGD